MPQRLHREKPVDERAREQLKRFWLVVKEGDDVSFRKALTDLKRRLRKVENAHLLRELRTQLLDLEIAEIGGDR